MGQSDTGGEISDEDGGTGHDEDGGTVQGLADRGREYVPQTPSVIGRGMGSGAAVAVGAGAAIVSGIRALRRGDQQSAFRRLMAGGMLAVAAGAQRRRSRSRGMDRSDVEETDVVDTAPDIEIGGSEDATMDRATGEEASEVVDTTIDIEDVESDVESDAEEAEPGSDAESDAEAEGVDQTDVVDTGVDDSGSESDAGTETTEGGPAVGGSEDRERLGEAAFDEQSGRVPAPQEAFNLELLSSGAEAFWGIRETDDAVVVTVEFDQIEATDEFRYVASSEVDDDDRKVQIPDTVLNHWDDVAGGGTAVTSGTDIVFVISDELRAEDLLLVVPEQWADEAFEEMEE